MANPTKFDPKRKSDAETLTSFSYGKHACFGREKGKAFMNGMVKLVADLRNLRPAAGEMGTVKTIQMGGVKMFLNDSWSSLGYDASSEFRALLSEMAGNCLLTWIDSLEVALRRPWQGRLHW